MSKLPSVLESVNDLAALVGVPLAKDSTMVDGHLNLVLAEAAAYIRNYQWLAERRLWETFGVCCG